MKKLVIGILAHVDAGKTTLSESMLYLSGKIRKLGRVDNKDAYLDTYALEKARGITIFAKQALFEVGDTQITLLDTPGHVDFSAEMERTLSVLDYAILVVSGSAGVQGHTKTLWRLLEKYQIPVFIFVNKMDQQGTDRTEIEKALAGTLDERCVAFDTEPSSFFDALAMCSESLMETYLEEGEIAEERIREAIARREVFPVFFGAALKLEGVEAFMEQSIAYTQQPMYHEAFGAQVFKISRDEQGNRLTHMKITGGLLKVKDSLKQEQGEEKVNQIRLYSGTKFEAVSEATPGMVCAVPGLTLTKAGEGIGIEKAARTPLLEPVLAYTIRLPQGCDVRVMLPKLRQLEEEEPELHIVWDEELQEIQAQLMGEVQLEILQSMIQERFGVEVTFSTGEIVYKETIRKPVEGVGHFEPLRHYAEVHIVIEPLPRGSGVQYDIDCSEDILDKNWQRLILSHLQEKTHRGVLTGSQLTDVRLTLVTGRAHKKHTEGGDFREATYRAVRQGLRRAESVLLEPYYAFQLEVPEQMVGRAMTDVEKMQGTCEITEHGLDVTVLTGSAPVAMMKNYQKEVTAYTKGQGRLFCSLKGYEECRQPEDVIYKIGYDPERDMNHPTGSVFCSHGAGFSVPWDEVERYMHLEYVLQTQGAKAPQEMTYETVIQEEKTIGYEEIEQILSKTFYANQGEKTVWRKKHQATNREYNAYTSLERQTPHKKGVLNKNKEAYLLVDGYNIIFAWEDLREIAKESIEGARIQLLEKLCNYQGIKKNTVIVVFDAYKVEGNRAEIEDYLNIHQVFTKEAQTADHYIEKFVHEHQGKYDVTVATSDGLEQIIIRGKGAALLSARELKEEIEYANQMVLTTYQESQKSEKNYLSETLSEPLKAQLEALRRE